MGTDKIEFEFGYVVYTQANNDGNGAVRIDGDWPGRECFKTLKSALKYVSGLNTRIVLPIVIEEESFDKELWDELPK